MKLLKKISTSITNSLRSGYTVQGLSLACSAGMYINFSPFPGLHGLMTLASSFLFGLHLPTVFLVATINNPWTMVFFYGFDYFLGYAIVHNLLGLHPTWVFSASSLQQYWPAGAEALSKYLGSGSICVWSFLVGGNVAGLVAAIAVYPLIKTVLQKHSSIRKQP